MGEKFEFHSETENERNFWEKAQKKITAIIFPFILGGIVGFDGRNQAEAASWQAAQHFFESAIAVTENIFEEEKQLNSEETKELAELQKDIEALEEKTDHIGYLMWDVKKLKLGRNFLTKAKGIPNVQEGETEVSNFEKVGLKNEVIKEIVAKIYPKSWSTTIKSISFAPREEKTKDLNVLAQAEVSDKYRTDITFFEAGGWSLAGVINLLNHEGAHANDWQRNPKMSLKDRIAFAKKVQERVDSQNRFKSDYVENIKHQDPKMTAYAKGQEYWAEIMYEYLRKPPKIVKSEKGLEQMIYGGDLKNEDIHLIQWFLGKTDPDFDAVEAAKQRKELLGPYLLPYQEG